MDDAVVDVASNVGAMLQEVVKQIFGREPDAMQEAALRAWNDSDPPDALEQARNDAIEGYQKNRNPFVDRPDFVAKISDF